MLCCVCGPFGSLCNEKRNNRIAVNNGHLFALNLGIILLVDATLFMKQLHTVLHHVHPMTYIVDYLPWLSVLQGLVMLKCLQLMSLIVRCGRRLIPTTVISCRWRRVPASDPFTSLSSSNKKYEQPRCCVLCHAPCALIRWSALRALYAALSFCLLINLFYRYCSVD